MSTPVVSPDPMKAAHDSRRDAVKREKALQEERLQNSAAELEAGVKEVLEFHAFLSLLDMNKYRKKPNIELSNAISFLAQALTSLNKYSKGVKSEEL